MPLLSTPRPCVRSITRAAVRSITGAGSKIAPISSFVAVGDSITERISGENADFSFLELNTSGYGAALEVLTNKALLSYPRNNAYATDRSYGYSGITAAQYLVGGPAWLNGVIPINDAVTALNSAGAAVVHIGTNDIAEPVATIVASIHDIWDQLAATGKPVIGTDILQRTATYPGWTPALRDKVNDVNAELRSTWRSHGVAAYRQWDDLIDKDASGFAQPYEFPNDGIHPTQRVGLKLGRDLASVLTGDLARPTIPTGAWVTPNPDVAGDVSGLATDWNWLGMTPGVDVTPSKVTDGDGVEWQRISRLTATAFNQQGPYCRATSGGAGIPPVGTTCRASAIVKVISGDITGISLDVQQVGAPPSSDWSSPYQIAGGTTIPSPILEEGEQLLYSEPFDVQTGTSQMWILMNSSCSGPCVFDFREAGIFEV